MKIRNVKGMAALAATLLLGVSMSAPVYADAAAAPWLTFTGQAQMDYSGPTPMLSAVFANNSPSLANGTAYAVLHDSLGQTVAIATSPILLSTGQNATAVFFINVPFDSYTVDLFILDNSGVAISPVTNSTVVA